MLLQAAVEVQYQLQLDFKPRRLQNLYNPQTFSSALASLRTTAKRISGYKAHRPLCFEVQLLFKRDSQQYIYWLRELTVMLR